MAAVVADTGLFWYFISVCREFPVFCRLCKFLSSATLSQCSPRYRKWGRCRKIFRLWHGIGPCLHLVFFDPCLFRQVDVVFFGVDGNKPIWLFCNSNNASMWQFVSLISSSVSWLRHLLCLPGCKTREPRETQKLKIPCALSLSHAYW